jgi:DNA processing protein
MNDELLYRIALTLISGIGDVHAKTLIDQLGDARTVFKTKKNKLELIEGIGSVRAKNICQFSRFGEAEDEIRFIEKYRIDPIFITDSKYPTRLLHCYDSPVLLYYRGNADLNADKIVSIVGTRNNSEYGRDITEKFISELAAQQVLVCSGLAFGIDSIAHKAALKNDLCTVGVLAHGLDMIYPGQNKSLAKQMTAHGGLLTDFRSNTNPDKQNFPRRNRIVAGVCDALVVMESSKKGGSLITADLAGSYNREVFAFPGKVTDVKSEGCNLLVRQNKASLITSAKDLVENMRWNDDKKPTIKKQRQLFIELSPEEKIIVNILQLQEMMHTDELRFKSGLTSGAMATALLGLEMQHIIISLPGKMYKLF